MDDQKRAAHELYVRHLQYRADIAATYSFELEQNIFECRDKIEVLVLQFLCNCLPQERFKFQEFPNLILQSSSMDFFEPKKAAEAFANLESYITLLCIMPWKQEFHQMKKYGGFYQTKIESHLKHADSIFKLIGFSEVSNGLFVLTHSTKIDLLQYVAFECFVASTECHIMESIWNRTLKWGLSVANVIQIRQQNTGTEDDIVLFIETKYEKYVSKGFSENVIDGRTMHITNKNKSALPGQSSTDPFRNKLETYMQTAKQLGNDLEDIPFIDEGVKESEYTPIDLDEQILASLQLVEGNDVSPALSNDNIGPSLKPSQEWSFVREGLEKSYGKKYFDGVRKDILDKEPGLKPHDMREGKYVKVYAQNADPGYVNSKAAWQLQKSTDERVMQHDPEHTCSPTVFDSDYDTGSSATFPPTITGNLSMRMRGTPLNRQVTDTILTKVVHSPRTSSDNRLAKTEPILRRIPLEQNMVSYPYTRQYYPASQAYGYVPPGNDTTENIEHIKRYQKRISTPLALHEQKMDPTKFLPVVSSAPVQGAKSLTESTKRNTVDSAIPQDSKTIRNISHQINPVKTNNLATENGVTTNISNKQWPCPYCTYLNNRLSDVCDMCSKSRDTQMEIDSPPCVGYSSRICEKCTLENERDSVTCHACGQELKSTQTVV